MLGFDACINYKTDDLVPALKAACPERRGDIYFENVGGTVFAAIVRRSTVARAFRCAGSSRRNNATGAHGWPGICGRCSSSAMMKGFIISDHADRAPAFLQEVAPLVMSGRLKYREDIVDGLDAAPSAFIGLLQGKNFGKLMVRVSPDPDAKRLAPK